MKSILAALILATALAACQKSHESSLVPPSSLFTTSDLREYRAFTLTQDDISARMKGAYQFYVKEPTASPQSDTVGTCIQTKLAAVTLSADKINVVADATLDLSDCVASTGVTLNEATYHVRYWLGCPHTDVSALNGQPLGELGGRTCGDTSDYDVQIGIDYIYGASGMIPVQADDGTTSDQPYEIRLRRVFAVQLPTGEPCPVTHSGSAFAWHDGCELVETMVYEKYLIAGAPSASTGYEEYLGMSFTGIQVPDAGTPTWFSAGTMTINWDDWSGTVSYSDAAKPPTWSLSNGTLSATGTVGG